MNPGPMEEVGKVAGGFLEVMKSQPLSLALVVMNLSLLFLFFWIGKTVASQREREINLLYADQKEIRELMSRCTMVRKENES